LTRNENQILEKRQRKGKEQLLRERVGSFIKVKQNIFLEKASDCYKNKN